MKFSAFAHFGHLRFSGKRPPGETYYRDLRRNRGGSENVSDNFDSASAARDYCTAMALARAQRTNERAGSQFRPLKAVEMLPSLESEYGIVPVPGSTIAQRQQVLAAAAKIARGARQENVESVLRSLLGADFIAYLPAKLADITVFPSDPGSIGQWTVGNWQLPGTLKAVYKTTAPMAIKGAPVWMDIELIGGDTTPLAIGKMVTVDLENIKNTEVVEVLGVADGMFQGFFLFTHPAGTSVVTGRTPNMTGTKRHSLVVLSSAAIRDANKRRIANFAMRKLSRGVSTWELTDGSGPFLLGSGVGANLLDCTPLGALS